MQHSSRYIVLFAAAVCAVCSIFVAASAVSLKDRQLRNKALDIQKKVLAVAGLTEDGESLEAERVESLFAERIEARLIRLENGQYVDGIDPATYDQRAAAADPDTSVEAPPNAAKVRRLPENAVVYQVKDDRGELRSLILPIQGQGLWSTLYGFIALAADANTVQGITFYEHAETPGLGGEVDNPRWKSLWKGRKVYGPEGDVRLQVAKGSVAPPAEAPYRVDGLSGATITSRGVTNTLQFWLGENGFGDYLDQFRARRGI